jgi:tRNA G18 (ribose-2'-O)-methylase SpoU
VERIDTLELPQLAPYRTMRWQVEHRTEGFFVAESDKVVHRLLKSRCEVISLLLPEKWIEPFGPAVAARPENITVYVMEKAQLETLTGFTFYQGVLAVGRVPAMPTLESLLEGAGRPRLFAGVEGITSAENLGGLVRNCVGFGAQGLLVDRSSCSPYLRRAIRASMGTIFDFPAVEGLCLSDAMATLQRAGIRCIAAHPHTDQRTIADADLTQDCCLIFGSEGYGISPELLKGCDEAVAIPMSSGVDSLNVGSAAAVFLYEASRQRQKIPPS